MSDIEDIEIEFFNICALAKTNAKDAFQSLRKLTTRVIELEKRERDILEQQVDIIVRYTKDCEITYVNKAFCDYYNKTEAELIGSPIIDYIPEAYWGQLDQNIRNMTPLNNVVECERTRINADGSYTWQQWSEKGFFSENGNLVDIQAVARDITKRKLAEIKLYSVVQRFELLATLLPIGIFQIDTECNCSYINQHWMELNSQSFEQARGKGWLDAIHTVDKEKVAQEIQKCLEREDDVEVDFRLSTGENRWVHLSAKPLYEQTKGISGYLGAISDVTERKANEQKLAHMVTHDRLTGIGNRALFQETLTQAIHRSLRNNMLLSVFFLDLDGFKKVNDTLGHHVGDELLIQVAKRLQTCIRETDTLCRLGGDEFTIILENIMFRDDPIIVAEKIVKSINETFPIEGNSVHVSTSIGICVGTAEDYTAEEFTKFADEAMYTAKTSGKNNFKFHNPS